jgi:DNA/RNA-binding domain of Phe-tRNA-synthetase-like protein
MTEIKISEELFSRVPGVQLLCIECDVVSGETSTGLWELVKVRSVDTAARLKVEDISLIPAIQASRKAYKACGKDPARYRLSAEALLRRIVKGEELYRLGNIVDLLNLVSFTTGFSIGGYDALKINGPVEFGIGLSGEPYTSIGRGELNIEGLPVFRDASGAFGSPTSDSERTCVDQNTRRFLMVIVGFGACHLLPEAEKMAVKLLMEFACANKLEINIIK